MTRGEIRVLVVDDHAVVREGLKRILSAAPRMRIAGEAGSAREALEMMRSQDWDVVLLDIALPDRSGFEVLQEIKREKPALRVLVLSIYPPDQYAVRVMRAGAAGYLTKESAPGELIGAIDQVVHSGTFVDARLAEKLIRGLYLRPAETPFLRVSDRELEVLRLLAAGQTPKEIAARLEVSVKTVSTYRARLLEKLSLRNTAELIAYAIKSGLAG